MKNSRFHKSLPSLFDKSQLVRIFKENRLKLSHLDSIYSHFCLQKSPHLADVQGLPKKLVPTLLPKIAPISSDLIQAHTSDDKRTTKLLIRLHDGHVVESVIIRYRTHTTLCVSSQVGCLMKCSFCATGELGLGANLHSSEIIEQIWHASQLTKIDNITFMGQGEPLNNFEEVTTALTNLTDKSNNIFRFDRSKISLSTVGAKPQLIYELAETVPGINLALSLHAANPNLRKSLIPVSGPKSIDALMEALKFWVSETNRPVSIEYILIGGVNCSFENGKDLAELLSENFTRKEAFVDLIPYNPTKRGLQEEYRIPTDAEKKMIWEAINAKGFKARIRTASASGRTVDGGCGQLALRFLEAEAKMEKSHP